MRVAKSPGNYIAKLFGGKVKREDGLLYLNFSLCVKRNTEIRIHGMNGIGTKLNDVYAYVNIAQARYAGRIIYNLA